MFKPVKMFLYLIIIAGVIVAFILWNGGDKIRWFGKKSEGAGKTLKEKAGYIGDKSDQIKEEIELKKELIEEKLGTIVEKAEKHGIIKRETEEK